ncbi:hypothetical protein PENTCL1PPCAC_23445, partial [Pristionchus entomophagus]
VVNVDVFLSFVTTILGAAAAAEGGDGVTIVVGRTGVIPSRWGELLNFLIPPLPALLGVPPPPLPPNTTDGVFRRDSTDYATLPVYHILSHPISSTIPGEVLPEALLPGGEGEREERIESGEAARRPLSLQEKDMVIEELVNSSNSCSAWGDTRSRLLAPPPPNIETDGEEFL